MSALTMFAQGTMNQDGMQIPLNLTTKSQTSSWAVEVSPEALEEVSPMEAVFIPTSKALGQRPAVMVAVNPVGIQLPVENHPESLNLLEAVAVSAPAP
jgi:hypothetical protein